MELEMSLDSPQEPFAQHAWHMLQLGALYSCSEAKPAHMTEEEAALTGMEFYYKVVHMLSTERHNGMRRVACRQLGLRPFQGYDQISMAESKVLLKAAADMGDKEAQHAISVIEHGAVGPVAFQQPFLDVHPLPFGEEVQAVYYKPESRTSDAFFRDMSSSRPAEDEPAEAT